MNKNQNKEDFLTEYEYAIAHITNELQESAGCDLAYDGPTHDALLKLGELVKRDMKLIVNGHDTCSCGNRLDQRDLYKFCPECGQQLHWATPEELGKTWYIQKFVYDEWGIQQIYGHKGPFTLQEALEFGASYWDSIGGLASTRLFQPHPDEDFNDEYFWWELDIKTCADLIIMRNGHIESKEMTINFFQDKDGHMKFKSDKRYVYNESSYAMATWRDQDVDENGLIEYYAYAHILAAFKDTSLYDLHVKFKDGNKSNIRLDNLELIKLEKKLPTKE